MVFRTKHLSLYLFEKKLFGLLHQSMVLVKLVELLGFFILNPILSDLAILCKFGL